MNLKLRITGIVEQEDWSREAEIDARLSEMGARQTKEAVMRLQDEIPPRYNIMLSVAIQNMRGNVIGSLEMPKEDWPGVAEVSNEWVVAG